MAARAAGGQGVILLRDNYLDAHDRETLLAAASLLGRLGLTVYASPVLDNGKLLHVKGWRRAFRRQAEASLERLDRLAASGLPLVSCETVTRLMLGEEYARLFPQRDMPPVQSLEGFLDAWLEEHPAPALRQDRRLRLLPHCSEQTGARESLQHWRSLFRRLDLELEVVEAGCCGMSGLFGHERRQQRLSRQIFRMGWEPLLRKHRDPQQDQWLASGFSCRCQTREEGFPCEHPARLLDRLLAGHARG